MNLILMAFTLTVLKQLLIETKKKEIILLCKSGKTKLLFFFYNNQLSGQLLAAYGYGAPEFDSGIYTWQSDVYSFGVVMLELLTGRMSYDRYVCHIGLFA